MKKLCAVLSALLALAALLTGCEKKQPETAEEEGAPLRVTFFDVGKGDCILLEQDGAFMMIDAGYDETSGDVIAFLEEQGATALEALIITHYDKDHVGGAAAVVNAVPVKQVYLPGYEGHSKYYTALMKALVENDLPYRQVKEDVSFALSGVSIAVYASAVEYVYDGTKEGNDNNVSLVIAASYGQDSYLFAGDLEKAGISAYLEAGRGAFDVVKMPHHGSKKKNTDDFIADVQPKIAVITDSAADPAEAETLELLADAGADVYRTGQLGTVVITSTGRGTYSVS